MFCNSFHFDFFKVYILTVLIVLKFEIYCAIPFHSNSTNTLGEKPFQASAGNLLLTFGPGEVPEGFQEVHIKSQASENNEVIKRNVTLTYSICQDGSGGLCVPIGDCPADLTPKDQNLTSHGSTACPTDYECCYGYPNYERSCHIRGGTCLHTSECGHSPKSRIDAECDTNKDEICCFLA